MFYVCDQNQSLKLQKGSVKMSEIFRDECEGGLRKLGLCPGFEHSSGSRFWNREGCQQWLRSEVSPDWGPGGTIVVTTADWSGAPWRLGRQISSLRSRLMIHWVSGEWRQGAMPAYQGVLSYHSAVQSHETIQIWGNILNLKYSFW